MSRDWPCWAGETLNPSLGISYNRHISNSVHCFPYIYSNPYFTVGLQYQATWRALCLGLRIRHVSRGEGNVLRSSKPLNFQGPRSLVVVLRPLASCSETRVSPLFEVRVPPVLIEARAASCPRPACLRFSRSLYLRLGFPICNPKELKSSNSNTYNYRI